MREVDGSRRVKAVGVLMALLQAPCRLEIVFEGAAGSGGRNDPRNRERKRKWVALEVRIREKAPPSLSASAGRSR